MWHWQTETAPLIQLCVLLVTSVLFYSKLLQKHKYCAETENQNESFLLCQILPRHDQISCVVVPCCRYSLANLFPKMLYSKYDYSQNMTTENCHFWIGSTALLVVWGNFFFFFLVINFVKVLLVCCIKILVFSKIFFFHFGLVSKGLASWLLPLTSECQA